MQELVNWPSAYDEYRDTGEGGLFAWPVGDPAGDQ